MYIISQEVGRSQRRVAKPESRPTVGGPELVTFTSKRHDLIRLATPGDTTDEIEHVLRTLA